MRRKIFGVRTQSEEIYRFSCVYIHTLYEKLIKGRPLRAADEREK